jgi:hypothetical protein
MSWLLEQRSAAGPDEDSPTAKLAQIGAGLFPPIGTRVDFRSTETWFGIGESFAVKASIAASILNLFRGNADADKVSGVILKIDDAGGDAIDLVAFSIWVSKQGKRLQDPTAFRLKRLRIECMFGSLAIARTQSTKPSSRA